MVLLFAVLQVGLYFYTRSVVASAAADGARYGANSGVDATAGAARATALISNGLSPAMARQVPCTGDLDTAGGVTAARVHCRGEVRSVFFPAGRWIELDLTEESLQERS